MLVDGVGSSMIANAPYANSKQTNQANENVKRKAGDSVKQSIPANARAGSMKQPNEI